MTAFFACEIDNRFHQNPPKNKICAQQDVTLFLSNTRTAQKIQYITTPYKIRAFAFMIVTGTYRIRYNGARGEVMVKNGLKEWNEIKGEILSNPEVLSEYETMHPQYELIAQIVKARKEIGLTQQELAERIGTKQSNISRLESGDYNLSLDFIIKTAQGLGKEIHFVLR